MSKIKQYVNATSFRRALEERLSNIANVEKIATQRLRRSVAFDRFLTRIFSVEPAPWILKGGFAMQLRTENARTTKDIDLSVREGGLFSEDPEEQNNSIKEVLLERAKLDLKDFFEFVITGPTKDLAGAPGGGTRFHIEARMDGRSFEKLQLDVGIGDVWMEPFETLTTKKTGNGLGLFAAPQKLSEVGGRIEMNKTKDGQTEVAVFIPTTKKSVSSNHYLGLSENKSTEELRP